MQKRWSINSMMLTFAAFAVVLIVWVLWAFKMGFGHPIGHRHRVLLDTSSGSRGRSSVTSPSNSQANIPLVGGARAFPQSALVYFQFVFAAITPILVLGLGARPRELQGVDSVRGAVDHVHLHGRRVPDLGRRLLRPPRRGRLLRWLRDPPLGRRIRLRRGRGDRPATATRPRDRRAEQRADGRGRGRVCCGSAGTASTVATRTSRTCRRRRRC